MSKNKEMNKLYQRAWYRRQKNNGIVYMITNTKTGENYIGSTKNSLSYRFNHHVSAANEGRISQICENIRRYGRDCFIIEPLYTCRHNENLKEIEANCISQYQPTLNKQHINESGSQVDIIKPKRRYWTPEEEKEALAQLDQKDRRLLKKSINNL